MKQRRQKKTPKPKAREDLDLVQVEENPPKVILKALRRLQRLRVDELEIQTKASLRKMEEASEMLSLFALVKEGRETVLESVASQETVLRSRLRSLRTQERKAQKIWKEWKKDKPQKRFQKLMTIFEEVEKQAPQKNPQDLPPPKLFAQFPPAFEVLKVLKRDLPKDEKANALWLARENLEKAFEALAPFGQRYLKAWNAWEKALQEAKEAGIQVLFKEEPETPFASGLREFAKAKQEDANGSQDVATQTQPQDKTKGRNANAHKRNAKAKQ